MTTTENYLRNNRTAAPVVTHCLLIRWSDGMKTTSEGELEFTSRELAEAKAVEIRSNGERRDGVTVTVTVEEVIE